MRRTLPDPTPDTFSLRRIALPAFGPTLMFGIGEGAVLPVVALTAREVGASVPTAALVVTAIGIGSLLNNVPASVIAMRFGERWAIVVAGLWSALGMALCAWSASLVPFTIGVLMVGMSQAVYNLARMSYLTEVVPITHRARALSTLGGVMRIGVFIGPIAAAAAVHAFGLRAAFGIGIAGMLAAAGIGLRIGDFDRSMAATAATAAAAAGAAPAGPVTLRAIWGGHRPVFLTLGIAVMLVSAVRASRQVVIPLWADHLALSPAAASLIFGLAGGVEMLLFYPAGRVMDLKGRRWVAVPAMLIMGMALLLMPLTGAYATLLVAAIAIGFGNGLGSGLVMTLGADHSPKQGRAYFLGVWRFLSDCGALAGPAMVSAIAGLAALSVGIAAIGGVSLLAAGLLARWIPPAAGGH